MPSTATVRPIQRSDYAGWRPLWDGYNAFYQRVGPTALPEAITERTWERFFQPHESVRAMVAVEHDQIIGLVHYLFHRSTTRINDVCYIQDLFTAAHLRGKGIGRQLIQSVCDVAQTQGSTRVYWHTHTTNEAGRALYDKVGQHRGFIVYAREL